MIKNLHDFEIKRKKRTPCGDVWQATCYYKGNVFFADGVFLYHTKREIKKILRENLLKILNSL